MLQLRLETIYRKGIISHASKWNVFPTIKYSSTRSFHAVACCFSYLKVVIIILLKVLVLIVLLRQTGESSVIYFSLNMSAQQSTYVQYQIHNTGKRTRFDQTERDFVRNGFEDDPRKRKIQIRAV